MMADAMLTMAFDPASAASITRMFEFDAILAEEMAPTMAKAGDLVAYAMVINTWVVFQHPTGTLAASIAPVMISPWEVGINVGVPWNFRREFGFSGMTDSLGRFYPYDPAEPYAQPALDANADKVIGLMDEAVMRTWARIGGV